MAKIHAYLNPSLDISTLLCNSWLFSLNSLQITNNLVTTMHQSSSWLHYFGCMTLGWRVIKSKLCRNTLKIQWEGVFLYWFPLFPYWPHGTLTSQTEVCLKQLESACILVILAGHPQILKKILYTSSTVFIVLSPTNGMIWILVTDVCATSYWVWALPRCCVYMSFLDFHSPKGEGEKTHRHTCIYKSSLVSELILQYFLMMGFGMI